MSKRLLLITLGIMVLLSMLVLAVAGKSRFPLINKAVATIVLPIENALTTLGETSDGARGYWRALTKLQTENEQLKKENAELRSANTTMASVYAENLQLRSMMGYKAEHPTQKLQVAKVIARNFGDIRDSVYIDVGLDKGVQKEMAVVTGDGFVGIVDEVYGDYAKVLLLTSPRCKVGARVIRSDSRAVGVTGGRSTIDGKLIMRHVYRDASIRENDVIVTSGFSGNHPENIIIGRVSAVHMDSVGLLQEAEVVPAADISDVERVMVVVDFTPKPKIHISEQGGQAK